MCKKYNKDLSFYDYITDEYHGRTGVYMTTDDCSVLFEKIDKGWSYILIKDGFWLRCPDVSVVDTTDPFKVSKFGDKVVYFALFKYLKFLLDSKQINSKIDQVIKNNKNKYKNLDYYVSEGLALEGEIRFGGSDQRVFDLKNDFLEFIIRSCDFEKYLESAKLYLGKLREISVTDLNVETLKRKSSDLFKQINILNKTLHSEKKKLNLEKLSNIVDILPENDILIFVPTGCYGYMTSFINEKTANKIMLWEFHANKDVFHSNKYLPKQIINKKCLILDKSYTGKTLNIMADLVKKEGGIPIKLALFPKSIMAIKNADYVLLLDKIFESKKMKLDDNWVDFYYKNVLTIN